MSISPPPTFVQVHLALQSIHPHLAYLSPECAGACSRNSVYDVDRRKGIASASGQSVSALAGLLTVTSFDGARDLSIRRQGSLLQGGSGGRESFGPGVPEERASLNQDGH